MHATPFIRRCFLALLAGVMPWWTQAQDALQGQITDATTGEPVAYATLFLKQKQVGTSCDSLGRFQFHLNQYHGKDTCLIRHVSYTPKQVTVSQLRTQPRLRLQPRDIELPELSIQPDSVESFLAKTRRMYNQRKQMHVQTARVYVRETVLKKDQYLLFNDALGYLIEMPEDSVINKAYAQTIVIETLRKSQRHATWQRYVNLSQRKSSGIKQASDVRLGFTSLTNAYRWFELEGPLSPRNKGVSYQLQYAPADARSPYIGIAFKEPPMLPFKYFSGTLYLNKYTGKLSHVIMEQCRLYSFIFDKRVYARVRIDWRTFQGTYYLHEMRAEYSRRGITHTLYIKAMEQQTTPMPITAEAYWNFSGNATNPMVYYKPAFWQDFTLPDAIPLQKIAGGISQVPLREQFQQHHNQPYRQVTYSTPYHQTIDYKSVEHWLQHIKTFF